MLGLRYEEGYLTVYPTPSERLRHRPITVMQRKLIQLLADGYEPKEIAARLGKAYITIRRRVLYLRNKYSARNNTHLVVKWLMGELEGGKGHGQGNIETRA